MSKRQLFQLSYTAGQKSQCKAATNTPATANDTGNEAVQTELRSPHPVTTLDEATDVIA